MPNDHGRPELSAGDEALKRALHSAFDRADLPIAVQLDVTYRCELDCRHCYLDDKVGWSEMTTVELLNLIDQLYAAGVIALHWSGGEVFQRPDLLELLAYAGRLGFNNSMNTHGGNITVASAAALKSARVQKVSVSVYSLEAEAHDHVTRRQGSHAATLEGVRLLREAGVPTGVTVPLMAGSDLDMARLRQHFLDIGCTVRFGTVINRDHSGTDHLEALQLPAQEWVAAEHVRREFTGEPALMKVRPRDACAAARSFCYIAPDGAVWPCLTWPQALGNVREQLFLDIWRGSPLRRDILAHTKSDACRSCAGRPLCPSCPGEAFKQTGDFRKPPPAFHAQTRARMAAYEAGCGHGFTAEEWASVPDLPVGSPQDLSVFPIHRNQRGEGRRVQPPSVPGPSPDRGRS